jgi:CBS domain containing-hemolysin-like protein
MLLSVDQSTGAVKRQECHPVAAAGRGALRSLVLGRVLALIGLLAANAFFVAAEFSVVRSRRSRLEAMARSGDTKARLVLRATTNLARLLSASQFGITLASLGIGALAEESLKASFAARFGMMALPAQISAATLGTIAALALVTYGHVVFGELAPRGATINNPERVSRWLVPGLVAFAWITQPFTWLLNRSAELALKPFGLTPASAEENVHSADELRIIVEQSQEGGVLQRQDAALIEGVFEFSEKNAREVMTPRTAIDALDIGSSLDDAVQVVIETQRSRYPVYEESVDNIVGLVLAKDLIPVLRHAPPEFALTAIMRPIHVVPGSREVEEVLADFKRLKEHMAVVLDEYGGTAGIVTMEDLLEEIVGEILDEHDEPEMTATSEPGADVVLPGATHIGELNERFGLAVPDDEYSTIGGYIFGALGRLPTAGDRVTASHAVFTVKSMDGRRIETVAVDLHSVGDRRGKTRN